MQRLRSELQRLGFVRQLRSSGLEHRGGINWSVYSFVCREAKMTAKQADKKVNGAVQRYVRRNGVRAYTCGIKETAAARGKRTLLLTLACR